LRNVEYWCRREKDGGLQKMMREMMWEIKQTRCCAVRGALPPCLIQLVSKTKRTGERERSAGQKMVEREKHVKQEREREGVLETVG
jgi:hypothetical protein